MGKLIIYNPQSLTCNIFIDSKKVGKISSEVNNKSFIVSDGTHLIKAKFYFIHKSIDVEFDCTENGLVEFNLDFNSKFYKEFLPLWLSPLIIGFLFSYNIINNGEEFKEVLINVSLVIATSLFVLFIFYRAIFFKRNYINLTKI